MPISLIALLGVVVPLAVLGAAIVLRAACSLCRFTPPGYPRALKTVVLGCLVGSVVWAVPTLLIQGGNLENGPPVGLSSQLIIGLITFFATGAVYAASLKTSFDQAILIRLAEMGLVAGVGLLVGSAVALGIKVTDAYERGTFPFTIRDPVALNAAPTPPPPPDPKRTAADRTEMGHQFAKAGNIEDAVKAYRLALDSWRIVAGAAPDDGEARSEMARIHFNTAEMLRRAGRFQDAETNYGDALLFFEKLSDAVAGNREAREYTARARSALGLIHAGLGRNREAETAYTAASAVWERLIADHPSQATYRLELARCQNNLGVLLAETTRASAALAAHRRALELSEALLAEVPGNPKYIEEVIWSENYLGGALLVLGRPIPAIAPLGDALARSERLTAQSKDRFEYDRLLAVSHYHMGILASRTWRFKVSASHYAKSAIYYASSTTRLNPDFPGLKQRRVDLGHRLCEVGTEFEKQNDVRQVDQYFGEAIRIWKNLAEDFPSEPEFRRQLARTNGDLGAIFGRSREEPWRSHWAAIRLNDAIALYAKLTADFPEEASYQKELAEAREQKDQLERK
jgi:tetratricopeptide (TPR) repeat protein